MFKVVSVDAVSGEYGREYDVVVYIPDGYFKLPGKEVPCSRLTIRVSRRFRKGKSPAWIGSLDPDMCWKIVDDRMGCVKKRRMELAVELMRLEFNIQAAESEMKSGQLEDKGDLIDMYRLKEEMESPDYDVCNGCARFEVCDSRWKVYSYFPKYRLSKDHGSLDTWQLVSSVASVVGKLVDPEYPENIESNDVVGYRRCGDCSHCEFVVRSNDPDNIDPVTGVVQSTSDKEHERLPGLCDEDVRNARDTRASVPSMRCKLSGNLVWNRDVCHNYVWRGYGGAPKSSFVYANQYAQVEGSDIVGTMVYIKGAYKEAN